MKIKMKINKIISIIIEKKITTVKIFWETAKKLIVDSKN